MGSLTHEGLMANCKQQGSVDLIDEVRERAQHPRKVALLPFADEKQVPPRVTVHVTGRASSNRPVTDRQPDTRISGREASSPRSLWRPKFLNGTLFQEGSSSDRFLSSYGGSDLDLLIRQRRLQALQRLLPLGSM